MMVKNNFLGYRRRLDALVTNCFFVFFLVLEVSAILQWKVYTLWVWLCVVVSVCITLTACDGLSLDGTTRAI